MNMKIKLEGNISKLMDDLGKALEAAKRLEEKEIDTDKVQE